MPRLPGACLLLPLACFAAPAAAQDKPEERIVEWNRTCRATLQLEHGEIEATRVLDDEGKHLVDDDWANWSAGKYLRGLTIGISWQRPLPAGMERVRLRDTIASLRVFASDGMRKIPRIGLFRVRRTASSYHVSALAAAADTGATNYQASTTLQLDDLLAYAEGMSQLNWSYESYPTRTKRSVVALSGSLDLAPFREVAAHFGEVAAMLDAKAASFATQCERTPVYYDPNAEI